MEVSLRHSQFGVPVVVPTWEEGESQASHPPPDRVDTLPSHSSNLGSCGRTPSHLARGLSLNRPSQSSDYSLSDIIAPQRSQSDISALSNPGTPIFVQPISLHRSPSPCSDKQATPPETSFVPHYSQTTLQLDCTEKEAFLPSRDEASLRRSCHQRERHNNTAVEFDSLPANMNWIRRRSQREPVARHGSVFTVDEKRTVEQISGVTSYDEKQSITTHPSSLSAQISQARTGRVNAVVDLYIEPLLHEQASNGLAQSTFVVVPEIQSSADIQPTEKDIKVHELQADFGTVLPPSQSQELLVGFGNDLNVQVVRLQPLYSGHTGHSGRSRDLMGDEGNRFWQQPAVRQELDRLLKIRLVSMGLDVIDPAGFTAPFRRDGWTERGEQVGGTPNMNSPISPGVETWKGDHWDAGLGIWEHGGLTRAESSWQPVKEEQLLPGQASVKVTLENVTFRVQSAMGLYDIKTDKAVVVRVSIEV